MDTRDFSNHRGRGRGFVHVLLLVMFMFGVVVYGVLESQTTLLSLQSNEPTQTRVALNQAREGLVEFASREEKPAERDFAGTHPPYIYYNLYSAETVRQAAGDMDDVTTAGNALDVSFRYAANDPLYRLAAGAVAVSRMSGETTLMPRILNSPSGTTTTILTGLPTTTTTCAQAAPTRSTWRTEFRMAGPGGCRGGSTSTTSPTAAGSEAGICATATTTGSGTWLPAP